MDLMISTKKKDDDENDDERPSNPFCLDDHSTLHNFMSTITTTDRILFLFIVENCSESKLG